MKIAYEYSVPSSEQLTRLGLDTALLQAGSGCAVTAYDGDEPIGFGFVQEGAEPEDGCCIQVHPAYAQRQIDVNIRKLLGVRSRQPHSLNKICV
ncbi:hypothetical protein SD70_28970 [Gordoniibacillus kamchatkensis]|uniref:Uncharacterized protein n=1 Tax=Gordoniibacillus kamchatkensis TaxID=1590651 RepID=A0ABR5AAF7_9BACL|nr:hypothetical protein [Paenibacillus sp. VKM B-2647]KIL38039.1 hypothetical protein SD70_28970 [Paenibacillus sp. VKM B-2647]